MIDANNKLVIKKDYYNYYLSGKKKTIDLYWSFYNGFQSLEEAIEFIEEDITINKEEYLYLRYNNEFYPVAILKKGTQIIITKQLVFIKLGYYSYYQKMTAEDFIKKYKKYSFFNINNGFHKYAWDLSFMHWLEERGVEIPKCFNYSGKLKEFTYTENFKQAFFFALFDTKINVYDLNCLDDFLSSYMPSRNKLWKKGIKAINPFTGEAVVINKIYTKEMWENNKTENEKETVLNRYY